MQAPSDGSPSVAWSQRVGFAPMAQVKITPLIDVALVLSVIL
jgi:biopolymer transport protein ExbD